MYIFSDPVMCIVYWSVLLMIAFDLYAYGTVLENENKRLEYVQRLTICMLHFWEYLTIFCI